MAYNKKTWAPRIVPFPNRRKLITTGIADTWDVQRAEGTATQEGDGWSSTNMNDLETRIETGLGEKLDKTSVINNLTTTVAGSALDAVQGKELADDIAEINTNLTWIKIHESSGTTVTATIDFTQYKEIKLYLSYGNDGHVYTWNMLSDYLKTTTETLRDGYYLSSIDCILAYISIQQSGIVNSGILVNQSTTPATHTLTVYVR